MLKDKEKSSLFCEWLQINFDKTKNLKSQFGTNYLVSSNILRMKLHAMYYTVLEWITVVHCQLRVNL